MAKQVQALYEYEAQQHGDLPLAVGDIITLSQTDVGEGWLEGTNALGQCGVFPATYVEEYEPNEPAGGFADRFGPGFDRTPNINVGNGAQIQPTITTNAEDDDWGNAIFGLGNSPSGRTEEPCDWDSDFEDDDNSGRKSQIPPPKNASLSGSTGDLRSSGKISATANAITAANLLGSKTSFTKFTKSGTEDYLLGKINTNVPESDVLEVAGLGDGTYCWLSAGTPYSCSLTSPKKEAKFGGFKTFIAYQLSPSFNKVTVSRRYKHFDWLHERLIEKFVMIPIPPLPEKQISGLYDDEFVERRMSQLQMFVDQMCSHPILSKSEVWEHFLTCKEESKWKLGKRRAEHDRLAGGALFCSIKTPETPLQSDSLKRGVTNFTNFIGLFDTSVKHMLKTSQDQRQKYKLNYKQDFETTSKSFLQLGAALKADGFSTASNNTEFNLANAVIGTGEAYKEITKLVDDQPRNDWEPLWDVMHLYRGMSAGWSNILQIHAGATAKNREVHQMTIDGKLQQSDEWEVDSRANVISCALMAEINTFQQTCVRDMACVNKRFLKNQIEYYQKVVEKLESAFRMFESYE